MKTLTFMAISDPLHHLENSLSSISDGNQLRESPQALDSFLKPEDTPSISTLSFFPVNTITDTASDDTLYGNNEFAWDPDLLPVNTITGTAGDDTLYGNSEFAWDPDLGLVLNFSDDVIDGLEGDDNLYGQGGNDSLFGGRGDDDLYGGYGDDFLAGGVNTYGESGQDDLFGGAGADTFHWNLTSYLDNGETSVVINAGTNLVVQGLDSYFVIWDFTPSEGDELSGFSIFDYNFLQTASLGLGEVNLDTALVVDTSYNTPQGFIEQYDLVGILVDWTLG